MPQPTEWREPTSAPLHRQIYAILRREIAASAKPGDVLPSQNELAKRFKVSFLTVREALSVLDEDGVITRHRGRDTTVVDPHANQHLAVLIEQDIAHPSTSYFFRRVPQQVRRWFAQRQIRVRLYLGMAVPGEDNRELMLRGMSSSPELLEDLASGKVRGVVAVGDIRPELQAYLRELGVPCVGQTPAVAHRAWLDVNKLARMGIDHLVAQGRNRIAFMSWGSPSEIIRYAREKGIDVKLDWLRCDVNPALPGAGWDEFREIWSSGRQRPDGLLVTDDVLFADALPAIIESGVRIPQELMIVSHCNRGSGFWAPFAVDRLEADPDEMAEALGGLMTSLLEDPAAAPASIRLAPRLAEAGAPRGATKAG